MSGILVTGGTGHLGRELVPLLVAAGHNVRVLSRRPGPDHIVGDLVSGEGIADAVEGVDILVHLASGAADNGVRGLGYGSSKKTDVDPTARLVKLLDPETHVVYISIVGVDKIPLGYYRAKRECEQIIERSGLPLTILRTTQWHTLADEFSRRLAKSPVVLVPKGVRLQLLDVGEVARRMAALIETGPSGRAPDMGGPEVLDLDDIVRSWLRAKEMSRPVISIPFPGKAVAGFRAGYNLAPEHEDGAITWSDWLASHPD
jgi:uncharacterized protein YbjT (DUF2867 family)